MIYKIYRIIDNTNGNCYVGRTIQELNDRIIDHKSKFNTRCGNCSSKLILKNNDWKYELIEETDDITREKYWIHNSVNCINTRRYEGIDIENRKNTTKIYREKNRTKAKEYQMEYKEKNKNKLKENDKKYRDNNKDKRKEDNLKFYQWYKSWGGRRDSNNNSLLKISPDVFK